MFSVVELLVLAPLITVIAVAIKLGDGGPILYAQERTVDFGKALTLDNFKSMIPRAELDHAILCDEVAGREDDRVTPGRAGPAKNAPGRDSAALVDLDRPDGCGGPPSGTAEAGT